MLQGKYGRNHATPHPKIGYGVLVCLRRKQPNTLRLTSRAFRGINRRCRYTFIAEQRKRKSPNRTPFQVFDLGFHWCAKTTIYCSCIMECDTIYGGCFYIKKNLGYALGQISDAGAIVPGFVLAKKGMSRRFGGTCPFLRVNERYACPRHKV